jgi:hypothetical protein
MKFNDRLTHDFLEIFKKSYVITKDVCDFETKNNTNHKPLFVVCDFETRPLMATMMKGKLRRKLIYLSSSCLMQQR